MLTKEKHSCKWDSNWYREIERRVRNTIRNELTLKPYVEREKSIKRPGTCLQLELWACFKTNVSKNMIFALKQQN